MQLTHSMVTHGARQWMIKEEKTGGRGPTHPCMEHVHSDVHSTDTEAWSAADGIGFSGAWTETKVNFNLMSSIYI